MRTTVTLDQDVYEAAMQMAQASGERLGKVLSDLARRGLRPEKPRPSSRRFPVFQVAPGTPAISMVQLKKAMDEEGL